MQRDAIRKRARADGVIIDQWFADVVVGSSSIRKGLKELLGGPRCKTVYVYRIDRISRAGILHALSVVQQIRDTGAHLIAVADPFQLEGPLGDLVLAVMAYVAQQEREAIRLRQQASREMLEARGLTWGRPPTSELQRRLVEERAEQGYSIRRIAMSLKIPKSTVGQIVQAWRASGNSPAEMPPTERSICPENGIDGGASE